MDLQEMTRDLLVDKTKAKEKVIPIEMKTKSLEEMKEEITTEKV